MSKTEYFIWQCDTSLHLVTSLLVRNGSLGITLTPLTTLPLTTLLKYMSRPKSAAVGLKDIDIADILGREFHGIGAVSIPGQEFPAILKTSGLSKILTKYSKIPLICFCNLYYKPTNALPICILYCDSHCTVVVKPYITSVY